MSVYVPGTLFSFQTNLPLILMNLVTSLSVVYHISNKSIIVTLWDAGGTFFRLRVWGY